MAAPTVIDGRRQILVAPGHRRRSELTRRTAAGRDGPIVIGRSGEHVARRSLEVYAAVGRRLDEGGRP